MIVRIYDDSQQYINEYKEKFGKLQNIEIIHVKITRTAVLDSSDNSLKIVTGTDDQITLPNMRYNKFVLQHSGYDDNDDNELTDLRDFVQKCTDESFEPEYVSEGFNQNYIDDLVSWIERNTLTPKSVFFDFDRTISMIEELPSFIENNDQNFKIQTLVNYIFGTKTRRDTFKNMLNYLEEKSVKMYVVSNNNLCNTDVFRDMINSIHTGLHLLCGENKADNVNKVLLSSQQNNFGRNKMISRTKFVRIYMKTKGCSKEKANRKYNFARQQMLF